MPEIGLYIDFGAPFLLLFWRSKKVNKNQIALLSTYDSDINERKTIAITQNALYIYKAALNTGTVTVH